MAFDPQFLQRSFDFDRERVADRCRRDAPMEALRLAGYPLGQSGVPGPGADQGSRGARLSLRDTLNQVKRGAGTPDGRADLQAFEQELLAFGRLLLLFLEHHEALWGDLPASRHDGAPDEDADEH